MDRVDAPEVAALFRERADLMELLAGECFEIKLVFRLVHVTGGDRSIEHYVTRNDALFDPDVQESIFELMQKRLN